MTERAERTLRDNFHPVLKDLLDRLETVHPDDLPPSVRDLQHLWANAGHPVWPEDYPQLILTGDAAPLCGSDRESRRLRAMLNALQDYDGANVMRWSCSVTEGGVSMVVTCPNPEHEVETVRAMANIPLTLSHMVLIALAQMIYDDDPTYLEEALSEACILAQEGLSEQMQAPGVI